MNRILGAVLGGMVIVAAPAGAAAQPVAAAQGDQAAKLAEAHAIIATIFPPDQREAMFTKLQRDIVNQISVVLPAVFRTDPGLKAIFDDFKEDALTKQRAIMLKRLPVQMEAMAGAYTREFSLAELKDIHAFALTRSGGHYLSKSLSIIGDPEVAKANSETVAEINTVTQALLPAFKEKAMTYLKAHPDVAAKVAAEGK